MSGKHILLFIRNDMAQSIECSEYQFVIVKRLPIVSRLLSRVCQATVHIGSRSRKFAVVNCQALEQQLSFMAARQSFQYSARLGQTAQLLYAWQFLMAYKEHICPPQKP